VPRVNYPLDRFGFQFSNRFRNVIAELPGGRKIELNGRCGGMTFASLDHFFAGRLAPSVRPADLPADTGVPPDGSPLADYIMRRHYHSLAIPAMLNVFLWTVLPDRSTFFARGVHERTVYEELPRLRQAIDQGRPVPLVLIHARDLANIGLNHQVVAYGYDVEAGGMKVYLYDCNHPGEESTLVSDGVTPGFTQTCPSRQCSEQWRGFFVHPAYTPALPPDNLSHLLPVRAKALAGAAETAVAKSFDLHGPAPKSRTRGRAVPLTVTFERVTFDNPLNPAASEEVALALAVNGETLRWPRTGARVAAHGRRYALKRSIPVTVDQDGVLDISVALAGDAYASLAEEGEPVGRVTALYGKADRWGRGRHVVHSEGLAGGFTVEYTIAGAITGKDTARTRRARKAPAKETHG